MVPNIELMQSLIVTNKMGDKGLSAAYMGLTGFGELIPTNFGYKALNDAKLIKGNGIPSIKKETLIKAIAIEIDKRAKAGTWGTEAPADEAATSGKR